MKSGNSSQCKRSAKHPQAQTRLRLTHLLAFADGGVDSDSIPNDAARPAQFLRFIAVTTESVTVEDFETLIDRDRSGSIERIGDFGEHALS